MTDQDDISEVELQAIHKEADEDIANDNNVSRFIT